MKLVSVCIPKSVLKIGYMAFYGCQSLETIAIEDGLSEIDDYAFCNCPEIKCIEIPESVRIIGNYALGYCSESEDSTPYPIEDFVIIGEKGSAAEKYAAENNFRFELFRSNIICIG